MRIVGVDLGIKKIAYTVLDSGGMKTYSFESRSTTRQGQLRDLMFRADEILMLDPDVILIEDIIVGNNRKYSIQLAQSMGAVLASLGNTLVSPSVLLVNNREWKKQLIGKMPRTSVEQKDSVRRWLEEHHTAYAGFCGSDQDKYDATCIALYGLALAQRAELVNPG